MSKRSSGDAGLGSLAHLTKQVKQNENRSSATSRNQSRGPTNPYLARPVNPEEALRIFLMTARATARDNVPNEHSFPIKQPFCEIEARFGILKPPFGAREMRVFSSGAKRVTYNGKTMVANAFDCSQNGQSRACNFEGGITKTNFTNWTCAGLSEPSPLSSALGVRTNGASNSTDTAILRRDLVEADMVETVYSGYESNNRVCFDGNHSVKQTTTTATAKGRNNQKKGKMENKRKLATMDIGLPAALYDLRLGLATERVIDHEVIEPPRGWTSKRLKRRRSYWRSDKSFAWQLDRKSVV